MKQILIILVWLFTIPLFSQISGTITDQNGRELPFVNIYIENSTKGTTSNEHGHYRLDHHSSEKIAVVFQYIGYTSVKKVLAVDKFPYTLDVTMHEEEVILDEVRVTAKNNPANAIIRKAIAKRQASYAKIKEYSCDFYSKGLYKIKNAPKKILGQEIGDLGGGLDSTRSGIVYLSETISKINVKQPGKFKEDIVASKVSGNDTGFSFNTASSVNFSFYQNTIPIIEEVVSPIADFAFNYYRYKLEGILYQGDITINKIKVIPKRPHDRSFDGYIYIVDEQWELYGIDLNVTGEDIFFPALETLNLKQNFKYNKAEQHWLMISQSFDFTYKFFGIKGDGLFSAFYSNYNLNPAFDKSFFDNEILKFSDAANKKDSTFWTLKRPVELTAEEIRDYSLKDSIQTIRKSKKYLDSVDRVNNRFKLDHLFYGYTKTNSYKNTSFGISSPAQAFQFNTVQGWNSNVNLSYNKNNKEKNTWYRGNVLFDYGISDKTLRVHAKISAKLNNFSKPIISFSGGKKLSQFNEKTPIPETVNTISTLFFEDNYAKFFSKFFLQTDYEEELWNGVHFKGALSYEDRKPVLNNTDYVTINESDDQYTSNNPRNPYDFISGGIDHQHILKLAFRTRIRFNQKYYTYPDGKFNEYSRKTPELYLGFESVLAANEQRYRYQLLHARIFQNVNVKNKGRFVYNIEAGTFFNADNISFADYKHFNGNRTHINTQEMYVTRFNLMPYYNFSTNCNYVEAHIDHNFQGFLMNRLPLFKKLNYFLVIGGHAAITEKYEPYYEYSIGLNNLGWGKFRFLRLDYARAYHNGRYEDGFIFGLKFLSIFGI